MALVQKATLVTVDAASGSVAITLTGVTAGNALVKLASIFNSNPNFTISGVSDGSAFTVRSGVQGPGSGYRQYSMCAYRVGVGAGSHTVTTTLGTFTGGATYAELGLAEFSDVETVSPEVTWDANSGVSITSNDVNAGPVTSTSASDLFIGCADITANNTTSLAWSSPSGWTNLYRKNDGYTDGTGHDSAYWYPGSVQTSYTAQWAHRNISGHEASAVVVVLKTAAAPLPTIAGTSNATPAHGLTLTITGTNFGATQGSGSVTIGGIAQTVTSWSSTSIDVTVDRGTNKYGVGINVVVTDGSAVASSPFALTSLQPQSGWAFINLGTPHATSAYRITASGDLASGDQLAYDTVSGDVEVYDDATFSADASVTAFDVEAWTPTDGWGDVGTQTVSAGGTPVTATTSIAAAVQQGRTSTFSIAMAIQAARSLTPTVDTAVSVERTTTASIASAVEEARTAVANLNVAVQAGYSAAADISTGVVVEETAGFAVNSAIASAIAAGTSIDLAIEAAQTQQFSIQAAIDAANTASTSIATAIEYARSAGLDVSTAVEYARSATADIAAVVQQALTVSATIDVLVQAARTLSFAISAQIVAPSQVNFLFDLAIQAMRSATATLDTAVQSIESVQTAIQAAVEISRTADFAVATAVQTSRAAETDVDAAIATINTLTTSIGAAVRAATAAVFTIDAQIQADSEVSFLLNVAIQSTRSATAAIAAAVAETKGVSTQFAVAVQEAREINVSLAAAIQVQRDAAVSIATAVQAASELEFTIDAQIVIQNAIDVAFDVAVRAADSAQVSISAYVSIPGFVGSTQRQIYVLTEDRTVNVGSESRSIYVIPEV